MPAPTTVRSGRQALDRLLAGDPGARRLQDPSGREVVAAAHPIAAQPWVLAAFLPTEEAFEPARRMTMRVWLLAVAASLLAGLSAWWMLRRQMAPMAQAVQAAGSRFLDAPMTRTPKEAAEGRLNLLVGGDADLLARCRPVLQCFAENITHVGAVGAGHSMKLLHNFVSLGTIALISEAAACATHHGVDPAAFVDILAKGGGGAIVNQSSTAAWLYSNFYGLAKTGINGLTQQLSRELGGQNIRINAIAPGPIDTEANRTTTPQEIVQDIVKGLPLSRMGTPEDLVGMCLFLLSDEASWITGQIFNVDGGQIIRS